MRVKNLVPNVYYSESRDFSYIGRLLEIVFNYIKLGTDLVNLNLTKSDMPAELLDLLATTLGFESKHEYLVEDLVAICSVFSKLLKNKGSLSAIETAINTMLTAQNIDETPYFDIDQADPQQFYLYVPKNLTDLILLEDLFEYILPAGCLFTIRKGSTINTYPESTIISSSAVTPYQMSAEQLSQVTKVGVNTDEDAYGQNEDRSTTYTGTVFVPGSTPTPSSGYTIQLIAQKEGEFGNGSTIYGYTDSTKTTQLLFVNAGASSVNDYYGGNVITSLSNITSIYLYNPDEEQSGYKIGSSGQKTWINGGTGVTLTFDSDTTLYLITLGKD